jgi:hypothetical protein
MLPCKKVDLMLWRYIDRELSAREIGAISDHLRQCAACRTLYEGRSREAKLCRMAFLDSPFGEGFVGRFQRRSTREGLGELQVSSGGLFAGPAAGDLRFGRRRRGGGRWGAFDLLRQAYPGANQKLRRLVTVAAMLLLIPGIVLLGIALNGYQLKPLVLGEYLLAGKSEGTFRAGEHFRVPEGKELEVFLRSQRESKASLLVSGPALLRIEPGAAIDHFEAFLDEGLLKARVGKLRRGESFRIRSPHALATVVGTEFTLEVLENETRLRVEEGTVAFSRANSGSGRVQHVAARDGVYRVSLQVSDPEPFEPLELEAPDTLPAAAVSPPEPVADPELPVPPRLRPVLEGRPLDLDVPVNPGEE